jgi:hypothetical protein
LAWFLHHRLFWGIALSSVKDNATEKRHFNSVALSIREPAHRRGFFQTSIRPRASRRRTLASKASPVPLPAQPFFQRSGWRVPPAQAPASFGISSPDAIMRAASARLRTSSKGDSISPSPSSASAIDIIPASPRSGADRSGGTLSAQSRPPRTCPVPNAECRYCKCCRDKE